MKNVLYFFLFGTSLLVACQTAEKPAEENKTPAAMPAFAYTIEHPADNWTPGKMEHVATALSALKAFENGDMDACMPFFADSVKFEVDGYEAKLSRDSLKAAFANNRSQYANFSITMSDWETVVSKDGKTEYVSLWYKEKWTDKMGVLDSLEVMDDLQMENGKISSINEKTRHYGKK
jgi:hypothetical protein